MYFIIKLDRWSSWTLCQDSIEVPSFAVLLPNNTISYTTILITTRFYSTIFINFACSSIMLSFTAVPITPLSWFGPICPRFTTTLFTARTYHSSVLSGFVLASTIAKYSSFLDKLSFALFPSRCSLVGCFKLRNTIIYKHYFLNYRKGTFNKLLVPIL
jgi:hypothetical protein